MIEPAVPEHSQGSGDLRIRLRDLAAVRVSYGYRRLHLLLRPKADTNWLVLRSPRTAAEAAFAFTPASIRRRFAPIRSSQNWTHPTTDTI